MKTGIFYLLMILFCAFSCQKAIEKPKNILSEDEMANLIADFSINEQAGIIGANINGENSTRFILKKYKTKGEMFTLSYQYYMTKPETMKDILTQAQEIIIQKDPKADEYIRKKLKNNSGPPPEAQ